MTPQSFQPDVFFSLQNCTFADIFHGVTHVWEVLRRVSEYSQGKLVQGKDCVISPTANIREGVILGDNVHIGHAVELKNCVILNSTHIAHLNYVGDSIIGCDVNLAGGAICANFRFDEQPIGVKATGGHIDTGLDKFSAIIGDGSKIGANAVLNPGTILGKKSLVYPLTSVRGVHPESSIVR
jgi:NDP-sugar pyrophosphorylase family protein